jgi:hypothetical protein
VRFSLRLGVYLPSQVLQIIRRFYHVALASRVAGRITHSRAASLRGHCPASSLLSTRLTPSRLRPLSRCPRLYGLPSFRRFRSGTRRVSPVAQHVLVTMPSITTPPECPSASVCSVPCCLRQVIAGSASRAESFKATSRSLALRPGDSPPSFRWRCR